MKLERFFEKFDQFADAPDAVAKMRELIMWSAFSGAFTEEVRNQLMPEEWAMEGAPTLPAIPSSWKWQRGSEVFDVIRGVSYKKTDASDNPAEGFIPVLRANNIGNGINFDDLVYVPRDNIWDEQFLRLGDILIAMSSGSKKLVGKAAPIITDFNGSFGAFCGVIRNKSTIPDEVLARYFQSPQYTSWVTAAGRGIGINNLGRGDLDSLPVPTPPLAEQKRIVAMVDELMALCDRLVAQQREQETRRADLSRAALARFAADPTPANLELLFYPPPRPRVTGKKTPKGSRDGAEAQSPASFLVQPADLRKTILTLAVQGKLVPQDPNDGTASQQFEAIQVRKTELVRKQVIKTSDSLRPVDPDEVDHDIPESWVWVRLVEICELITDGTHLTPKYTVSGRMFLSAQNVKPFKFMPAKHRFVSEEHYQGYVKSRKPEKGDVLLTRVGAGIGEAATIDQDLDFAIYVSLGLIRPVRGFVFPDYITLWLNSPDGTEKSSRNTYGKGVSQGNLNLSQIRNFLVPLPPLVEQRRIVAKVEQLMSLVDALEHQLAASREAGEKLLAALVAELTRG